MIAATKIIYGQRFHLGDSAVPTWSLNEKMFNQVSFWREEGFSYPHECFHWCCLVQLFVFSSCSWANDTPGNSAGLLPTTPQCTAGGRHGRRADPSAAPRSQSSPDTPRTLSTGACQRATATSHTAGGWRPLEVWRPPATRWPMLSFHDNRRTPQQQCVHSDRCWWDYVHHLCCCPDCTALVGAVCCRDPK